MAPAQLESVDEYIAAQPSQRRPILRRIHQAIRKAVPGAEEGISYGIPVYRLHGLPLLYFAGWSEHYSLYPVDERAAANLPELARYKVSKGTARFPLSRPIPVSLIARFARLRAEEAAARAAARPAKKRRR